MTLGKIQGPSQKDILSDKLQNLLMLVYLYIIY